MILEKINKPNDIKALDRLNITSWQMKSGSF